MKKVLLLTVMCVLGLFTVKAQETLFSYNFDDGSMTGWNAFQKSGMADGPNWAVSAEGDTYYSGYNNSRSIYSMSYDANEYAPYYCDNYIMTTEKYLITEGTVLSWFARHTYANGNYEYMDPYSVYISEDGEELISVWNGYVLSDNNDAPEYTESYTFASEHVGKEVYVGFYHYGSNGDAICLDNIVLTSGNGSGNEEPEFDPEALYRLVSTQNETSSTVYTYASEKGTKVTTVDSEGLVETMEYDANGLLLGYTAKSGEEVISEVDYTYNADGVMTGYAESSMSSWGGSMFTQEFAFGYVDGKLVSVASPKYKYVFTYNADGLVEKTATYYTYEDGSADADYEEVYTYENGKLVNKGWYGYDWFLEEMALSEETIYTYDANGNCIAENVYSVYLDDNDQEVKNPYKVIEYEFSTTVAYENVFYFEYPHFAIINPAKPSFANIILSENSHYCYVNDEGEIEEHTFVETTYNYEEYEEEGYVDPIEPTAPANVTAVATGANSILLSWDPVEGAMGYGIYLFGEWQGGLYPEYTEYEFTSLASNTEYCFSVSAITEIDADGYIVGETEPSEQACATTEEGILPPNVTAEAISDSEIVLSWDAVDGALAYGIYMYGEWLGGTYDTSVTIEGLSPETEYCFTVISVSEIDEEGYIVGYSAESEQACATTKPIGVAEFSTAFNIYPNPANDVLFIENGCNIEQVTIYNVTGVMVYNEQCTSNNVQVNVADLEAGVYIIKVRTEHNEVINRFVKK